MRAPRSARPPDVGGPSQPQYDWHALTLTHHRRRRHRRRRGPHRHRSDPPGPRPRPDPRPPPRCFPHPRAAWAARFPRRPLVTSREAPREATMDAVLHRVSSPTFVGRADELAALDGALDRAATGVPAFTFVAGESGVGKSRLVAELEVRASRAGARVFVGHCLELGGAAIPYAPLVDALRPIARELADCSSEIADALPPAPSAAPAELMPEFGGEAGARRLPEGQGHQARLFEGLL